MDPILQARILYCYDVGHKLTLCRLLMDITEGGEWWLFWLPSSSGFGSGVPERFDKFSDEIFGKLGTFSGSIVLTQVAALFSLEV